MPILTCPKCGHTFGEHWKDYLKKVPGHKVHFFSSKNDRMGTPVVTRTRLHFRTATPVSVIRAALELIAIEHLSDPFFRWSDHKSGTIDEVLHYLNV